MLPHLPPSPLFIGVADALYSAHDKARIFSALQFNSKRVWEFLLSALFGSHKVSVQLIAKWRKIRSASV